MRKTVLAIVLITLCVGALPAAAQQASAPTATGESGLFTLLDGWTLGKGEWSLGFYYDNWDRLVAPEPGGVARPRTDDWDYDWNRLSASVGYGLTDRFELSVMVPYEDLTASDNRHQGFVNGSHFVDKIDGSGLGNVRVGGKFQMFSRPEEGEALSLNAFVELPTGDEEEGIVTGGTGWGFGVNWDFAANWLARVGYRDPGSADAFDVSNELQAGVGYSTAVNDRFDWITELAMTFYQGGDTNPDDSYDLTTGGRYWIGDSGKWAMNFGLRVELNQLSDTDEHCPIGGLVGLTFRPRAKGHEQILAERLAAEKAAEEARIAAEKAAEEARIAAEKAAAEKAAAEKAAAERAAEEARLAAEKAAAPVETREEIHFPSSSDRLSNIAKAKLDEVALRLKQNPAATALIIGHADGQGSESSNQSLGLRRAESAKKFLVTRHQIDETRIAVESRGSAEPVASNDEAAGREQNRRAVIVVRLP